MKSSGVVFHMFLSFESEKTSTEKKRECEREQWHIVAGRTRRVTWLHQNQVSWSSSAPQQRAELRQVSAQDPVTFPVLSLTWCSPDLPGQRNLPGMCKPVPGFCPRTTESESPSEPIHYGLGKPSWRFKSKLSQPDLPCVPGTWHLLPPSAAFCPVGLCSVFSSNPNALLCSAFARISLLWASELLFPVDESSRGLCSAKPVSSELLSLCDTLRKNLSTYIQLLKSSPLTCFGASLVV